MNARRTSALTVLVLALLTLFSGPASAAPVPDPGVCVDEVGLLGADTCAKVTELLTADEEAHGEEIAVLIVDTTDGQSIESYANQVFNTWGLGQAGADNGVLLVVALDDRKVRIEVGDGLSSKLSDGTASEIVSGELVPYFKQEQYRQGVLIGLDAIRASLGYVLTPPMRLADIPLDDNYSAPYVADEPYQGTSTYTPTDRDDSNGMTAIVVVVIVLVLIFGIAQSINGGGSGGGGSWSSSSTTSSSPVFFSSSSSGSSSSSSGSSSSSSSFGGGSSSGGGASGSW